MKRGSGEHNHSDQSDNQPGEDRTKSGLQTQLPVGAGMPKGAGQTPPSSNLKAFASRFFVLWLLGTLIGFFKDPLPADDPALQGSFLFHTIPSAVGIGVGFLVLPLLVSGFILFFTSVIRKPNPGTFTIYEFPELTFLAPRIDPAGRLPKRLSRGRTHRLPYG